MKFTILDMPQGSPEWKMGRCGRMTGSRAKDVLATVKSGEAAARRDYRTALMLERLTGQPADDFFVTKEMQWGTDQEPFARMAYEAHTGLIVRETGFLQCDDIMAGASVDGDIDNFAGIVEYKCPKSATHWNWLRAGVLPSEHKPQITCNLWISGAEFCDFASYDPRFPDHLKLFVFRVYSKDLDIAGFEREAMLFLAEVDAEEAAARAVAA